MDHVLLRKNFFINYIPASPANPYRIANKPRICCTLRLARPSAGAAPYEGRKRPKLLQGIRFRTFGGKFIFFCGKRSANALTGPFGFPKFFHAGFQAFGSYVRSSLRYVADAADVFLPSLSKGVNPPLRNLLIPVCIVFLHGSSAYFDSEFFPDRRSNL